MEAPYLHVILLGIVLGAAVTDVCWNRVPNWLTGSAIAIGVVGHASLFGQEGLLFSVEGLGLGFALFFPLYLLGGSGGGDIKLLATVGSFVGPGEIISVACLAGIVGGLYAAGRMVTHWGFHGSLQRLLATFRRKVLRRQVNADLANVSSLPKLRYALATGLGTAISFF